jgi:hypothetical protein
LDARKEGRKWNRTGNIRTGKGELGRIRLEKRIRGGMEKIRGYFRKI